MRNRDRLIMSIIGILMIGTSLYFNDSFGFVGGITIIILSGITWTKG